MTANELVEHVWTGITTIALLDGKPIIVTLNLTFDAVNHVKMAIIISNSKIISYKL